MIANYIKRARLTMGSDQGRSKISASIELNMPSAKKGAK
jgi:hypothetical protein